MSYFLAGKCDRSLTQGTAFLESVLIPLPTRYGKETLQWLYPSFWTEQTHKQNTMCFVLIPVFQCSVSHDSDWVLWGLTIFRGGHPVDFFMITVRRFISWHVSSEAIITFLFALGISWFFSDSHIYVYWMSLTNTGDGGLSWTFPMVGSKTLAVSFVDDCLGQRKSLLTA